MKKKVTAVLFAMAVAGNVSYAQDTYNDSSTHNETYEDGSAHNESDAAATASNGTSNVQLTFEGSDLPPYMPNAVTAPVVSPTLFNVMGKPAQIAGLPVLSEYFFSTAYRDVDKGESGSTKIVFNSARIEKRKDSPERKLRFDFSGKAMGRVIGSLTVQSRTSKSDEVDLPSVIYDATHYISGSNPLKGYDILLLSSPEMISYSVGVDAKSQGVALSPVLSGLINGPLGALTGLSSGYSNSGGVTVPTALVGCTFLVVLEDGGGQPIDIGRCFGKVATGPESTDQNGRKRQQFESTK